MKTEQELNSDILKITKAIDFMFPHLTPYLGQVPAHSTEAISPDRTIQNLNDYYDSLDVFFKYYLRYDTNSSS